MTRGIVGCLVVVSAVACGDRPAANRVPRPDTVVATQLAVFGEVDGPQEYLFGRVAAVAADDSGAVYVADGLGSIVRAYNTSGKYLGTVGTEGSGPAEFRYLRDLGLDPDNNLHVRGAFRVSVFRKSEGSEFADSVVRTLAVRGFDSAPRSRGKSDGSRYYIPSYIWKDFLIRGYFYVVLDSLGRTVDTVSVPAFPDPEFSGRATYATDERGFGPGVEGVNRAPFEAAPGWDITSEGQVLASPGDRYQVTEIAPSGDTVQVIRYSFPPRPIPEQEAQDSARAFRARLDSIPVPLDRMRGMSDRARRGALPTVLPEILAIQVDRKGNIWLKRWPRSGEKETVFDILSPSGAPLSTVRIPADLLSDPVPWVSPKVVVGVVRDAATQTDRVAVFRLSGW